MGGGILWGFCSPRPLGAHVLQVQSPDHSSGLSFDSHPPPNPRRNPGGGIWDLISDLSAPRWCKEELGANEAERSEKSDEVESLEAQAEKLSASIAKLGEERLGVGGRAVGVEGGGWVVGGLGGWGWGLGVGGASGVGGGWGVGKRRGKKSMGGPRESKRTRLFLLCWEAAFCSWKLCGLEAALFGCSAEPSEHSGAPGSFRGLHVETTAPFCKDIVSLKAQLKDSSTAMAEATDLRTKERDQQPRRVDWCDVWIKIPFGPRVLTILWMVAKSISNLFESTGNHCLLVCAGESSLLLGGAGFRPATVANLSHVGTILF